MEQEKNSGDLGKLFLALSQAQKDITGAKKDANNPFFKSQYSTLASCWDACREPLAKNKLSVIQLLGNDGNGITVTTILGHESGQSISSTITLTPTKSDPQGAGSAITYARRYALSAIVGLAQVDDDANSACLPNKQQTSKSKKSVEKIIAILDTSKNLNALGSLWAGLSDDIKSLSADDKNKVVSHKDMIKGVFENEKESSNA